MLHDFIVGNYPKSLAQLSVTSTNNNDNKQTQSTTNTTSNKLRNLRARKLLLDDDEYGFWEMRSYYNPENDCRDAWRVINEYYTGSRIKAYNLTSMYG